MKPRLFIGSSREALSVAEAIHQALAHEAECLVWRDSFAIGGTTLGSLIATASNIDFAAFVFADDDTVELRGEKYLIARDNVIYELGLFTGHLSPDRCFFVSPDSIHIHIPSDLAGVTHGSYEVGRTDGNTKAAVAPFCSLLKSRITKLGFALKSVPNRLYDLAIKFECADWVNPIDARVRQKQSIVTEMITELRQNPVDKLLLLKQQRVGFYVLLAAAIQARPSSDDDNLILLINARTVPRGVAQKTLVDGINSLEFANLIAPKKRVALAEWLHKLTDVDASLLDEVNQLQARLR